MKISYNSSAALAANALNRNDRKLSKSLARLSSGLKIMNSKDDPAGLAMGTKMNAQVKGILRASGNASDAISVVDIADGAMAEIHSILQRINELAVKGATGSITNGDREYIVTETEQLLQEIERIAATTEFNGQRILDGSFDLKAYTDELDVDVLYYGDHVKTGTYRIDNFNIVYDPITGDIDPVLSTITMLPGSGFPADARIGSVDGNMVTIIGSDNFEMILEFRNGISAPTPPAPNPLVINVTGIGSMDMQIGADEGQQLAIRIPKISLKLMGISNIDMSTQDGCQDALGKIPNALRYLSDARSRLGAYQNRLEHTIDNLDIIGESMTSAYSRIMDLDMAEEMTQYTTLQILVQAGTSMLAQANERPSQVLQLLQ